MLIGVPKEIKNHEYRVGMTPASVNELVQLGHKVMVETQAGAGIGFSDQDYQAVGASIASNADEVFASAEMIVKVKEPQAAERGGGGEGNRQQLRRTFRAVNEEARRDETRRDAILVLRRARR